MGWKKGKKRKTVPCQTAHPRTPEQSEHVTNKSRAPSCGPWNWWGVHRTRILCCHGEYSAIRAFCTGRYFHLLIPSFLRDFIKAFRISPRKLILNARSPKSFTSFLFGSTALYYFSWLWEFPLKSARNISLATIFVVVLVVFCLFFFFLYATKFYFINLVNYIANFLKHSVFSFWHLITYFFFFFFSLHKNVFDMFHFTTEFYLWT